MWTAIAPEQFAGRSYIADFVSRGGRIRGPLSPHFLQCHGIRRSRHPVSLVKIQYQRHTGRQHDCGGSDDGRAFNRPGSALQAVAPGGSLPSDLRGSPPCVALKVGAFRRSIAAFACSHVAVGHRDLDTSNQATVGSTYNINNCSYTHGEWGRTHCDTR